MRAAGDQIRAALGTPWLLVNITGVFSIQRITELAEAEWDRILDTNLKGPFLTCREFLPAMIDARDGCIVNVASTAGVRGGRRRAGLLCVQGRLVQLSRSLAIDHGPDGVRVNCVCPGLVDTAMADWIRDDEEALTQWADRSRPADRHPGRHRRDHRVPGFRGSPVRPWRGADGRWRSDGLTMSYPQIRPPR